MPFRLPRRLKYLVFLAAFGLIIYSSLNRPVIVVDPLNRLQQASAASRIEEDVTSDPESLESSKDNPASLMEIPTSRPNRLENDRDDALIREILDESETHEKPFVKLPVIEPFSDASKPDIDTHAADVERFTSTRPAGPSISKFPLGRKEHYPVAKDQMYKLPTDKPKQIPLIQAKDPSLTETMAEKATRLERRRTVREAFARDWSAYRKYAWMHDELMPVSNSSKDPFGGWGATLVDALDTLLIMEMHDSYEEASAAVAKIDFTFTDAPYIPLFETTIRYLGGLLAAYDVGVHMGKKDEVMLSQAKSLSKVLYGAFDTPNRMPMLKYSYKKQAQDKTGTGRAETSGVMSEAGSLSVEFTRLAQLSEGEDRNIIFDAVQKITDAFEEALDYMLIPGLWPVRLDFSGCKPDPADISPTKGATDGDTHTDGSYEPRKASTVTAEVDGTDETASGTDETASGTDKTASGTDKTASGTDKTALRKDTSQQIARRAISAKKCEKQGIRAPPYVEDQTYSQGALADSTYEYFTKEYLLLGGISAADQYKRLYEQSMDATKKWLVFKPLVPGDLGAKEILMAGDVNIAPGRKPQFQAKMQHLTCFVGGMVAMGSKVFDRPDELQLAARLTDGCVWAYNYSKGGVSPEVFHVHECKDQTCSWQNFVDESERQAQFLAAEEKKSAPEWSEGDAVDRTPVSKPLDRDDSDSDSSTQASRTSSHEKRAEPAQAEGDSEAGNEAARLTATNFKKSQDEKAHVTKVADAPTPTDAMFYLDTRYIMRPEAIESVWYMYRITGDRSWQEKGWQMWLAIDKITRTRIAHTAVLRSDWPNDPVPMDSLESFWFAETLKYFYLLFSDFQTISLDEWVLNTEAHPLRRPQYK